MDPGIKVISKCLNAYMKLYKQLSYFDNLGIEMAYELILN